MARNTGIGCIFCGDAIYDTDTAYRKVEGFERKRGGGGTNALRLRVPKDEWACAMCVDRESRGVSYAQSSLIEPRGGA
jgi:hypothetical protein